MDELKIRNCRPVSRQERTRIRRKYQLTGFLEYDKLDGWQLCEVRPNVLRTVHGDFRGEPLVKGELLNERIEKVRARIEAGTYEFANEIRRHWPSKPPIYVLRTSHNGELYVYDGQKRTLNACFNNDEWIPALLVDVDERREVV